MNFRIALVPLIAVFGFVLPEAAAASPLAKIDLPPIPTGTYTEPSAFYVGWTVTTSGSPLDHSATLVASEVEIQSALHLGTVTPSGSDLQQYFGGQAPGFAGWTAHAPGDTTVHVSNVTPGQVYYLAVTAVDQAGAYDGTFTTSRNVMRFKPTTEFQAPFVTITSPTPDSVNAPVVPAALNVKWTVSTSPGTFIDHFASRIISEHEIQQAFGLENYSKPTVAQVEEYFGLQAQALAAWTILPASAVHQHIDTIPDGQVYYYAVTAVDNLGTVNRFFSFAPQYGGTQNLVSFRTLATVPTKELTWGAMKAKWR
jgi:hypothetical protein